MLAVTHPVADEKDGQPPHPQPMSLLATGSLHSRGGGHMLSEKSQRTQNGTMFVDLD